MSSLITNATIQIRKDTAGNWTSNNPTPAAGEWCKETDTGNLKQGDGSTAWTALGYNISLPETYNIASSNTVIALPDITGSVQRKTYYWTGGDGSNTFSFTVSDASTIGGVAATIWIGDGTGHISIESDGSNWQVREYEDSGSIANSGNNFDRKYFKTMKALTCIGRLTNATNNNSGTTATFAHAFIAAPRVIAQQSGIVSGSLSGSYVTESGTITTTTCLLKVLIHAIATITDAAGNMDYIAEGSWRT